LLLLLVAVALAGCGQAVSLGRAELDVSLTAARLADGAEGPVFRVLVVARGAGGQPIPGLNVRAALADAAGDPVAELGCAPVAQSPGTYQSEAFVPPLAAQAGEWTVAVTATRGEAAVAYTSTVQVAGLYRGEISVAGAANAGAGAPGAGAPDAGAGTQPIGLVAGEAADAVASVADAGAQVYTGSGPLLFGVLLFAGVLVVFIGMWRTTVAMDPMEARMKELGMSAEQAAMVSGQAPGATAGSRMLNGLGMGAKLAESLRRADVPLTAVEFTLIIAGAGFAGFALGALRAGPIVGLMLGAVGGYLPLVWLGMKENQRRKAFTQQLPDVLTLMVGALRAGYGLTQALQELVNQMPAPASTEFARVMRAIGLGVSVQEGLRAMSERIGTDDVELMVTAITVQFETGGNLAETLEIIGETIRDRVRILGEIQTLTAQQRLTGYILAALPLGLAGIIFLINPTFFKPFFQPGWMMLPITALVMMFMGFIIIRKIVDIEV
jgi:tight adherence protein B